jgi:DNA topoisomerase I
VTGPKKTDTDEVKEKKGRSKEPEKRPLVMRPEPVVVEPRRTFNEKGKTLIIVESPAKSKTIEKFLGADYVVKASMGHLRDLPKMQMGVSISNGFLPRYLNVPGRKSVIEDLRKEADAAKTVYLATDPDREGEAISWHLAHILNMDGTTPCRVTFNEITKSAIQEAVEHPRAIDMHMVDAQQARRVLDRIVGYKLSPLLWKKICKGLSAGRVQSVAVRIICEREREIQAFVPEEYWTIEGEYKTANKEKFPVTVTHRKGEKLEISNEEEADSVVNAIAKQEGVVNTVETRQRSRKAPAPFTTSTMQQDGVRKLNMNAKRVMAAAQHLYEGKEIGGYGHVGLITYMRTDSTRISKEMQDKAKDYILKTYGSEFYPSKPNVFGAKSNAQDAHEAIRPTMLELPPKMVAPYLSGDELKLYTLIWNRFLASQMAPQKTQTVTMTFAIDEYTLKSVGSRVLFTGFTEVYEEANKDEQDASATLPHFEKGQRILPVSMEGIQHFTQPPSRYSEAGLIKILEEQGIGRPSTYAATIDTILKRNYVERKDKQFVPTDLGFAVVEFLTTHFGKFINTKFTASMEEELDHIAQGTNFYEAVIHAFYEQFEEELYAAESAEKIQIEAEKSGILCEKCGHEMVYKLGPYGKYLACSNYPNCRNIKSITVSTGVTCPKCKSHEILERKSKRGRLFYGCEGYPECDFTMWDKPIDKTCPVCGSLMAEKVYKNGNRKEFCSNPDCVTRPKRKSRSKKEDTE